VPVTVFSCALHLPVLSAHYQRHVPFIASTSRAHLVDFWRSTIADSNKESWQGVMYNHSVLLSAIVFVLFAGSIIPTSSVQFTPAKYPKHVATCKAAKRTHKPEVVDITLRMFRLLIVSGAALILWLARLCRSKSSGRGHSIDGTRLAGFMEHLVQSNSGVRGTANVF
jgi:hypothetical protein